MTKISVTQRVIISCHHWLMFYKLWVCQRQMQLRTVSMNQEPAASAYVMWVDLQSYDDGSIW